MKSPIFGFSDKQSREHFRCAKCRRCVRCSSMQCGAKASEYRCWQHRDPVKQNT